MIDITMILAGIVGIACVIVGLAFNKLRKNNDIKLAIEANSEFVRIAGMVVKAANELSITNELKNIGLTKAEYAMQQAKKELEALGFTYDEARLEAYIKAAVTDLRVAIAGTDAEERKSE